MLSCQTTGLIVAVFEAMGEDVVASSTSGFSTRGDRTRGLLGIEVADGSSEGRAFLLTCWDGMDSLLEQQQTNHGPFSALPVFLREVDTPALTDGSVPAFAGWVASFFAISEGSYVVGARADGIVSMANDSFCSLLGRRRSEMRGTSFGSLLVDKDAAALEQVLGGTRLMLNFVDASNTPHTLSCTVQRSSLGISLIGERNVHKEAAFEQEVLRLNNELAVLSRENARKSKQLARALGELREAQSLLVHTEKMASLGQLTAGVAHEINNPLAFVASNHATLQRDFQGLLQLVNVIGDGLEEVGIRLPSLHGKIVEAAQAIRLDHLVEAVPRKLEANIEGLERIQQLVLDLRTFTRLDEAERKSVDLGESLRAALRFLEPLRTERGVELDLEFSPMPPTVCAPGALNQAVSNVVTNAIQASQKGSLVRVLTSVEGDWHLVEVIDAGEGIPPSHVEKIFDPFFTTKPVGVGMGLGLNIAYQVVKAHGGRIDVESVVGSGTRMTIRVPGSGAIERRGSG
jgi:signal transduction histidine kinase